MNFLRVFQLCGLKMTVRAIRLYGWTCWLNMFQVLSSIISKFWFLSNVLVYNLAHHVLYWHDLYGHDWLMPMTWPMAMTLPMAWQGSQPDLVFLAATKQLYDWFSLSVRPSVRPSVRHTFFTMFPSSYHHEIFRSYYQWQKWRPCKRWRSEVKGQGHRGQHPT